MKRWHLGLLFLIVPPLFFLSLWERVTPHLESFLVYPHSRAIYDREGKLLRVFLSSDEEWCLPISLPEMGKWLPLLAVEIEDRRFFRHPGVDGFALLRALWQNLKARRVVSGASTITTQLVRLTQPGKRTLGQKMREMLISLKLETMLSKETILESYLNRVPLGGNIRGVEAAALFYFGKKAQSLSLGEAALLVGMLPEPERLRPDKNPERAREKRALLLQLLRKRGIITPTQYAIAVNEPLPGNAFGFPQYAYHATEILASSSSLASLSSTLSLELQTWLEKAVKESLQPLPREIIACGLVVENATGHILAYVGNGRFLDNRDNWVDCAQAPRSPGSALKPFVYALAFEQGLLTPSSLLADTPLGLGGHVPRNFDERYRGPVSCRLALAHSLNVPAARVMRAVRPSLFLATLRQLGFAHLDREASFYGDSLILGGCEVTALEMAQAYTALARLGEGVELSLSQDAVPPRKRVFSPGATYLIADILADRTRFAPLYQRKEGSLPLFAFKTGTSYGLRDAWTVAYNPQYTVVVWYGDPTGKPHQELVGLQTATPLAAKIMKKLTRGASPWYEEPPDIEWREVCALSGKLPSPFCPHRMKAPFLKGISPLAICDLHQLVNGQVVTVWPRELAPFLEGQKSLPPSSPLTPSFLSIVSPVHGKRYLPNPLTNNLRLPLKAETKEEVYWFVDGEFVGKSQPGQAFFTTLSLGTHTIVASSLHGATAQVTIEVGYPAYALQDAFGSELR